MSHPALDGLPPFRGNVDDPHTCWPAMCGNAEQQKERTTITGRKGCDGFPHCSSVTLRFRRYDTDHIDDNKQNNTDDDDLHYGKKDPQSLLHLRFRWPTVIRVIICFRYTIAGDLIGQSPLLSLPLERFKLLILYNPFWSIGGSKGKRRGGLNAIVREFQHADVFFQKSNEQDTIDERCDIAIRFVFQKTFFTVSALWLMIGQGLLQRRRISITTVRSPEKRNTIVIPWIGVQITLTLPPYLIDWSQWYVQQLVWCTILRKQGTKKKEKGITKKHRSRSWLFPNCFFIFLSIYLLVKFIFIFFFKASYETAIHLWTHTVVSVVWFQ